MRAEIEPLSGVLRVWANGKQYGEPYEIAASVRWLSRDKIEILGLSSAVNREAWRAITKACSESGIKRILAVRYRAGQRVEKWIDTQKWSDAMSFSGSLKTELSQVGEGLVMQTKLECQCDNQPFFRGLVVAEWADPKNAFNRIEAVAAELNMEIASYDDLCLAQAKVADGIDDLGHLGQLYAAANGMGLPKTESFLKSVATEDRIERAELRDARRGNK